MSCLILFSESVPLATEELLEGTKWFPEKY